MITSSISNNFRKFEKDNNKNLKSFISSSTSEAFNNTESILKTTLKYLHHSKSLSSKFNKQTTSSKMLKIRFNYKDFNRDHLIEFKKETYIYCVFKAFLLNIYMNLLNIKALSLSSLTKS